MLDPRDEPIGALEAAAILHAAPDAVLVIDRSERILFANAAAAQMFGVETHALIGSPLAERLPTSARPAHHDLVASFFAAPMKRPMGRSRTLMARRHDGAEVPVDIALAPALYRGQDVVVCVLRDRSAQHAAERARAEAEQQAARARAQMDCAAETIIVLDAAGRITDVNAAWGRFARANGADEATATGIGLDYLAVCRRDPDARALVEGLEAVLAGRQESFAYRYRCNSPAELRRYSLRAQVVTDSGGCEGAVVIHTDVTERELADDRLAVQRAVAAAIAAGQPVVDVCRVLADQVCERLEWDAWELWTNDEADQPRLLDVCAQPGVDISPFIKATRQLVLRPGEGLPGRVWQSQRREWVRDFSREDAFPRASVAKACGIRTGMGIPLKSGAETFLMMSFFCRRPRHEDPATQDLLVAIGAQIAEVSRRQRAEEQARASAAEAVASRAKLHAMLQYAPGFLVEVDREGRIRYINQARTMPAADFIGRHWLSTIPQAEHARLEAVLRNVLETGASLTYDLELPNADGNRSFVTSRIGPLREPSASGHGAPDVIVGAVIVAQDVTEQKRVQAELDAAQRLASVGTLAAGVAHEINNPLSAVIANLALAVGDVGSLVDKGVGVGELLGELEDARDAADRIRAIACDLKLLARPKDEPTGAVDATAVFESMLRLADNEIRHRARVVRHYHDVPLVEAAEGRLGQVLLNLLLNAAQALPDGHVDEHEIRVGVSQAKDGTIFLEVGDTGPGIAADVKQKLFTPFFTTKAAGTGTGLGLAICAQIVQSFGGRIEVDSELGKGATFRVLLAPARSAARRSTPGTFMGVGGTTAKRRVLVIDDEPAIGTAVRRVLAKEHDVTVTHCVRDALLLLDAGERYDLILCDVMMPELGGVDFLETLAERLPEQCDKVVLVSGGVFSKRAEEFIARRSQPIVEKPFDPRTLRELVARHGRSSAH